MEVGNRKLKRSRKERNLHESLVEDSQESVTMIEAWKHLPYDLLEVILTWLPIVVLFRFRLVCKSWNSVLSSLHFQQCWEKVASKNQPMLFLKGGGIGSGLLYNPLIRKWHQAAPMPLTTLASDFPLTSSRGLVCFLDTRHTAFFVGNPLSRTWRELSCNESKIVKMEARDFVAIGMVNVSNKGTFTSHWNSKIVLLGYNGGFEVFTTLKDFCGESPMIAEKIPSHIKMPSYLSPRAVNIGMDLLFLGSYPHGIIFYNVVSEQWMQILLSIPLNTSDLALIECNGQILLTGVVKDRSTSNISVRVWKIDSKAVRMCMEIDRMPSSMCSEFDGKAASYSCLCNRNMVIIMLKTSRMTRLYTYDVANREWSKISKFKVPRQNCTSTVTGIGFFPSFAEP